MAETQFEEIQKEDYLDDGRKKINSNFDKISSTFEAVNNTIEENAADVPTKIKTAAEKLNTKISTVDAKAESAIGFSNTAVSTSNHASATADNTANQFDELKKDVQDLIAESGNDTVEIVAARKDTKGVMQPNLATRLEKDFGLMLTEDYLISNGVIRYRGELTGSVNFDSLDTGFYSVEDFEPNSSIGYPPSEDKSGLLEVFTKKDCTKLQRFKPINGSELVRSDKNDIALSTWQTLEETLSIEKELYDQMKELADEYDQSLENEEDESLGSEDDE